MAFYLLRTHISWPESLNLHAEEEPPLINEERGYVFTGYYFYLMSSIIFLSVVLVAKHWLKSHGMLINYLLNLTSLFTIISVAFRALGILRWLFVMPNLALTYVSELNDSLRQIIILQFDHMNLYAGMAGEHMGVQLFGGVFIILLSVCLLLSRKVHRIFSISGLVLGVMTFPWSVWLNLTNDPLIFYSGVFTSVWTIGLGVYLLFQGRARYKQLKPIPVP